MFGTILNVVGILLGGLVWLIMRRPLVAASQEYLKLALGVYTVWTGLRIALSGLHGSAGQVLKQLLVAVLALMLGKLLGRALHLQQGLSHLGRVAGQILSQTKPGYQASPPNGFLAATILFCAAPLAMLGPVQDGLNRDFQPLLLKGVMDGLVVMGLLPTFGWRVMLGVFPLAAVLVTLTQVAQWCEPMLRTYSLFDPVNVVCGLLIFCVALIIFAIRKVAVADYLPALVLAPLLTSLWR